MKKKIIHYRENKDIRIDKYLMTELTEISRTVIQNLINEKYILVNNLPIKSNYKLKKNDEINIIFRPEEELDIKKQDIPLNIVYEDEDLLIVNKEKGMVVHPAVGHRDGTLVNALMFRSEKLSSINGIIRPGIVHRIDKDTSGLLIVAKNDKTHVKLSEMISKKEIKRKYYALVHGVIKHDYGTIDAPIARNPRERKEMAIIDDGKCAITHFRVIKRYNKYTLIECELETGRTHQIRVHMKYIKFPLVGDLVYGPKKTLDTSGQMLHSKSLEFMHPISGKAIHINTELPKYFEEILDILR
ncbi:MULTISPECIES: RluA family pseudouridine synthase [unclassified Gemella]|uniref:RluA family pseudouridine synthase n=1 Tax=unclassified Gemella TaxID=2624949 RepID=UPI001073E41E|nr:MULTISPECIES: RluA family pseudouridine synthase [unclassified Gemella]MBF0710132.1 RluA family pseudouridine synthase [Gemella sp. GL1.1]MBF0746211.1 RluA family pseudouridine synthase [Gemella sp. 19428wG2_WT2a]NYS27476.1 RluA family pseudouridine synthase [Gemella sp. GL1]TFU60495.1 RluA family pseudouridine synthase [Gemella sp. WT2a]